jgi:prepilin signal peptidase PulO-like enzyme (type II secretory pathway)
MFLLELVQFLSERVFVFVWAAVLVALFGYWFFNMGTANDRLARAAAALGVLVSFISIGFDPLDQTPRMYQSDPVAATVLISVYGAVMVIVIIVLVYNLLRYVCERVTQRLGAEKTPAEDAEQVSTGANL